MVNKNLQQGHCLVIIVYVVIYVIGMTENEIVMNAMIFFGAGYDLTSNTLMFAVYELALHKEMQEKLFEEIDNELGKVTNPFS